MRSAALENVRTPVRIAIGLAVWLTPVWGATLELLSLNNLITQSTTIVQAQVTASSASYTGTVIYTHYQVSVLAQWKGAAQTTIDVMVPGGTVKGMRQTVPGVPQLAIGRQYVLFLWTSSQGRIYTMGLTQGVFTLSRDSGGTIQARQMPTTETIISPVSGQAVKTQPISMPLGQLISAIQAGGTGA